MVCKILERRECSFYFFYPTETLSSVQWTGVSTALLPFTKIKDAKLKEMVVDVLWFGPLFYYIV